MVEVRLVVVLVRGSPEGGACAEKGQGMNRAGCEGWAALLPVCWHSSAVVIDICESLALMACKAWQCPHILTCTLYTGRLWRHDRIHSPPPDTLQLIVIVNMEYIRISSLLNYFNQKIVSVYANFEQVTFRIGFKWGFSIQTFCYFCFNYCISNIPSKLFPAKRTRPVGGGGFDVELSTVWSPILLKRVLNSSFPF